MMLIMDFDFPWSASVSLMHDAVSHSNRIKPLDIIQRIPVSFEIYYHGAGTCYHFSIIIPPMFTTIFRPKQQLLAVLLEFITAGRIYAVPGML